MFKLFAILCSCAMFLATTRLHAQQTPSKKTTQQLALGSIGLDKEFILQTGFNSAALPTYSAPIKVSVRAVPFTKSKYKQFLKANKLQASNVTIGATDSIVKKPMYIEFNVADKIALLTALNQSENTNVKTYLKNNKSSNVLTSVAMAFNPEDFEAIMTADAVFLEESSLKTYALQLYKDGNKTALIKFNQGTVFGFDTSNCCWQENNKRQLTIVDLVNGFSACPNGTYKSANRANKKVNYFKL